MCGALSSSKLATVAIRERQRLAGRNNVPMKPRLGTAEPERSYVPNTREEEILYANLCNVTNPQVRDTLLSELDECLRTRASDFGVNQNSLVKLLHRKAKKASKLRGFGTQPDSGSCSADAFRTEAAELVALIDTRRRDVLQRVGAIGSGKWRTDLATYFEESGLPAALDDLFLLGGEISDDVWGELMPAFMFPRFLKSKCGPMGEDNLESEDELETEDDLTSEEKEYVRRLKNAADEAIGTVLIDSRAALARAIACPRDGVKLPVCVGYCRTTAKYIVLGENVRDGRNIPFGDTVTIGDGMVSAVDAGAPDEPGEAAERFEGVTGEFTKFVDAIARFNAAPPERQREIVQAVWRDVPRDKQEALWLSHSFQNPKRASGFPEYLESPLPEVPVGAGLTGKGAAEKLGTNPNAFYKRVYDAKAEFETCVIKGVNRDIRMQKGYENESNR